MTKLMHRGRGGTGVLPSVLDWADPPWASLFPFPPARSFRVEDYVENGRYVSGPNCLAWTRPRTSRSPWTVTCSPSAPSAARR